LSSAINIFHTSHRTSDGHGLPVLSSLSVASTAWL